MGHKCRNSALQPSLILCLLIDPFPQDFGKTWTNLTDNSGGRVASFVDFDWGALLNPWWGEDSDAEDTTIFATVYEDPKHMKVP